MLEKFNNFIKSFRSKKQSAPIIVEPVTITSATLIENANQMVEKALYSFKVAINQIEYANQDLTAACYQSSDEIESLKVNLAIKQKEKETAEETIKANNALKEKLSQFVVK